MESLSNTLYSLIFIELRLLNVKVYLLQMFRLLAIGTINQ